MTSSSNEMIKKIRAQRGLSQEDMAKDLGVTSNYISLVENGRKNAGNAFLKKLSNKYSIPLIILTKGALLPEGKSKKEKEVREKILKFIDDLEKHFLHA